MNDEMNSHLKQHLSADAVANIQTWLTEPKYNLYKSELEAMIAEENWQDLEDRFFQVISFGTAGIRGTTGIGSSRINKVTIGEATQALCTYAQSVDESAADKGIVIACDTRLSSPELSQYAACVAAKNGFKTYIFDSYRSTPQLSFAVRELGCAVGVVISASHNPPADNGFKAYWSDGAQLVAPHDKGVLDAAHAVQAIEAYDDFDAAVADDSIVIVDATEDTAYIDAVLAQSENTSRDLRVVYSPLHGAGTRNSLPVLEQAGFTVLPVESQMTPDGHFPTVEANKPNPEEKAANDRAVALLLAEKADIAITNDPDADRLGVMVRVDDEAVYLSGNQTLALATEYVLSREQDKGTNPYIAHNIVTTGLLKAIADNYGVTTYSNILIGFKYIGELILNKEATDETFVIGGEESFGMLKGDYVRDKDGAVGALLLAEYAAELKAEGKTLVDKLYELYEHHGLYIERLDTLVCPGASGFSRMQTIMTSLREQPPDSIDGHPVTAVLDYQNLTRLDTSTGETTPVDCIKGNVLTYECGHVSNRITIRPSGTEPKLKFYVQWHQVTDNARSDYDLLSQATENISRTLEGIALERG